MLVRGRLCRTTFVSTVTIGRSRANDLSGLSRHSCSFVDENSGTSGSEHMSDAWYGTW